MDATDRFSTEDVQRILGLTGKQLDYWDRLRLVSPQKEQGNRFYDFRDLISLRTVKQLVENGVPANRLRRALAVLREKLAHVHAPLAELRVLSDGKDIVVENEGARLEPLSGQFVLNFEIRELGEKVRVIAGRNADDWFATALEYEADGKTRAEAIDAYDHALCIDPQKLDALLNCGTLCYEEGNLKKAAEYFERALRADPENALTHFNLGSVLEEVGRLEAARLHLRHAVRLDPSYPDAHYNLAFVCEKLGAQNEAQRHWQAYVTLDPASPWCGYARQHLASSKARSASST
ncbi:MAG TPA: tetratricopeptide repeat protein [Candidatus Udaeobacter sp.]|jgi:tetratricopeptide (TPR) repeat protein|nr:tetratricopeptide repeat protein [Candidatus Udaeobacter sp.]